MILWRRKYVIWREEWRVNAPANSCRMPIHILCGRMRHNVSSPFKRTTVNQYMPDGTCGVLCFGLKGGREVSVGFMDKLRLAAIVTHGDGIDPKSLISWAVAFVIYNTV